MTTQRYAVTQPPINTLFTWINSGEIAIPEIQRPFVWDATKVRNFLDSLYKGYPVGYLIAWRNPNVRLKDGTTSSGKRILIDGQQRVMALRAALLGDQVLNKDYQKTRIKIAFHPVEKRFEVSNPAIAKDILWIPDISILFRPDTSIFDLVNDYCAKNKSTSQNHIFKSLELVQRFTSNQIGLIELDSELDIETVTEIFIRVNSEGVPLSQADFAMSKIAVNESCGGNIMRKAIDYFCHMSITPDFHETIKKDTEFAQTDYFGQMAWLKRENDDLYDPAYTDMLRVAFSSEFKRGKLEDLVALLSGRNFETRQYEQKIIDDSFKRLKESLMRFMNETNFKRFLMIIKSAGFINSSLIRSQTALNFAYILYLMLRSAKMRESDIEQHVRRWYVLSVLKGRYSGSPESTIDYDIRQIDKHGIESYTNTLIQGELSESFWSSTLPQELDTSVASSPYFYLYQAAQIKMGDFGFLSRDITARELIEIKCDVHHVYPKDFLKKNGLARGQYNQIANYVVAQSEINIAIGNKEPKIYFSQLLDQCNGGSKRYGNITNLHELKRNFSMNCIPDGIEEMTFDDYPEFLNMRRKLMAKKFQTYFESL